jgi:hypothetical protein
LRVAKKAVVVTVPHDGPEKIAQNIRDKVPHAHLHDFTLQSFRDMIPASYGVSASGHNSTLLKLPFRLIEGKSLDPKTRQGIKVTLVKFMNKFIPLFRPLMGETIFKIFLSIDPFLATNLNTYRGVRFIITKSPDAFTTEPRPNVNIGALLDFKVPLFRMTERVSETPIPAPAQSPNLN